MDKQKNDQQQLPSLTIVIFWALIQAFGWGMIYLLAENMNATNDAFMLGFIGLFTGGLMGALQYTLIERGVGIQLRRWLILTAFGTAIGFTIPFALLNTMTYSPYVYLLPIFVAPSVLQWKSLRRHTQSGILWVVAHGISTLIFVMFVELILQNQYNVDILVFVLPALLQGIISGFVMVWLLRKLPKQELAYKKAKISYDNEVTAS